MANRPQVACMSGFPGSAADKLGSGASKIKIRIKVMS